MSRMSRISFKFKFAWHRSNTLVEDTSPALPAKVLLVSELLLLGSKLGLELRLEPLETSI